MQYYASHTTLLQLWRKSVEFSVMGIPVSAFLRKKNKFFVAVSGFCGGCVGMSGARSRSPNRFPRPDPLLQPNNPLKKCESKPKHEHRIDR